MERDLRDSDRLIMKILFVFFAGVAVQYFYPEVGYELFEVIDNAIRSI